MNIFRDASILLVDDESYLIDSMYKFLKNKGYQKILTAKNIAEARFKLNNTIAKTNTAQEMRFVSFIAIA